MSDPQHDYAEIVIWCESREMGHRSKGVVVASLYRNGLGGWSQRFVGGYRREWSTQLGESTPDLGTTVMAEGRAVPSPVPIEMSAYSGSHTVYEIVCPVCSPERTPAAREHGSRRGVSLQATESNLARALDKMAESGKSRFTLSEFSTIVVYMAQHA